MDFGLKTIVWWDKSWKIWCAIYQDSDDSILAYRHNGDRYTLTVI